MMFTWIILGLFIYFLYKNNESLNITQQKGNSSMEVLKQRYVKGEIDDETFEKMKKIIQE